MSGLLGAVAVTLGLLSPGITAADPETNTLDATGYLRVQHAAGGHATSPLTAIIDGGVPTETRWSQPSNWVSVAPGDHELQVTAGPAHASTRLSVKPGCRITVFATQQTSTRAKVALVSVVDCSTARVPPGLSRITTVLAADSDFGAVQAHIGPTALPITPLTPSPSILVPSGSTTMGVATSDGAETLTRAVTELRPGSTYTVLWIGGGETPPSLLILLDAVQAPEPPPPGARIQTGERPSSAHRAADETEPPADAKPLRLRIAAIGLDKPVGLLPTASIARLPAGLGLDAIAWLAGTSMPGQRGTTALIGHTTSTGEGAFARLENLRPGEGIDLVDATGRTWHYITVSSATFRKDSFPGSVWSPRPVSTLVLITCTRTINPATGIADNRIVWSMLDRAVNPASPIK